MSEASMSGRIVKALIGLDPVRVENRIGDGTPDINYTQGWIENKWVRKAPKRGGIITIEHYTKDQQLWAIKRAQAGGKVFLLLKVGNLWLLFSGLLATNYVGKVDLQTLKEKAIKVWERKLIDRELREILTR